MAATLRTLPRTTWLSRIALLLGGVQIACGFITLVICWLQGPRSGAQFPYTPWLQANTALSLALIGVILVVEEKGHRAIRWLALLPLLISLLSLFETVTGIDLGIDQLFATSRVNQISISSPGRMSPLAAMIIASTAFLLSPLIGTRRLRTIGLVVCGSILVAIGLAALIGHALSLPAVYNWGQLGFFSRHTAWLPSAIGCSLLLRAWRLHIAHHTDSPSWLPLPVVIASSTFTVILWLGLRDSEKNYRASNTFAALNNLASAINIDIDRQATALERIARRWAQLQTVAPTLREVDAMTYIGDAPAVQSLVLADANGRTKWIYPASGNENLLSYDHSTDDSRREAMREASTTNLPVVSPTLDLPSGGLGFAIVSPIIRENQSANFLIAEIPYQRLFSSLERRLKEVHENYLFTIEIGGRLVYESTPKASVRMVESRAITPIIQQRRIHIELGATPAYYSRDYRRLPELALTSGFGISLLLGLSVHLAHSARSGQRAAEASNRRLVAENEERRRVEAQLKISDERLRLALEATEIGIFEWIVDSDRLFINPGFLTLLGYSPSTTASTFTAWLDFAHPLDRPEIETTLGRLIEGDTSFIEPDYRARDGSGSWRWICMRGRTVTRNSEGRAERIVGTLQDITSRKASEDALRASQASTRKLSLVASRTDNLVAITNPRGEIEWINDSFENAIDQPLFQVVGQSLVTLLAGPETDPTVRAAIEAAIHDGQPMSGDVVITPPTASSDSRRTIHLDLELQPVFNDQGAIENIIAMATDITARVETERALRLAKAEADKASRAKSEFLASVSHEIRTPMNGVIGMTSLLLDTPLSPDQHEFVTTIRNSGDTLLSLINDILDLSKIESGRMELEQLPFELVPCIEDILDLFSAHATANHIELAYHVSPTLPSWIIGDVTRLRQILSNLVNNALKFTPSGTISIEVFQVSSSLHGDMDGVSRNHVPGDLIQFTVRDTGIGIPADRLDRLFKSFSQVDSSTTRRYGGTGLGLAICKRLCRLMGGDICVESIQGQGSTFVFTIRAQSAPPPVNASPHASGSDLNQRPIYLVEPNSLNRRRYTEILAQAGAQSVVFADPLAAALALHRSTLQAAPHAIILSTAAADSALVQEIQTFALPVLWLHTHLRPAELPQLPAPSITFQRPVRAQQLLRGLHDILHPSSNPSLPPFPGSAPVSETRQNETTERRLADETPLKILLVEDNAVNQKVALRFLQRLGYLADAVGNGHEAVATLESRHYDLVFMDVQMPEMDGFEATREIRSRLPVDRQPVIIALTANALEGDRDACLSAGMNGYLSKPLKIEKLASAIRTHCTASSQISAVNS